MNPVLRHAIDQAFAQARAAELNRQPEAAYAWLERAHILSQRRPLLHARVHLGMLRLGWVTRDAREVFGQLPRVLAALLFSTLWVPRGNSGRARVSAFAPAPLTPELEDLLADP
ncbi:MAG: DUF3703 domain-containing protein [Pseudomonas sp.]|uniref:DUF3703 domain-containing protein n=1 Tax=Pseudomonas sp. TaxID=306 RepID=UPI0033996D94